MMVLKQQPKVLSRLVISVIINSILWALNIPECQLEDRIEQAGKLEEHKVVKKEGKILKTRYLHVVVICKNL